MNGEEERIRAGVAAWQRTGAALERVRARELRDLTDAEALAIFDHLTEVAASAPPPPDDLGAGLLERQRLLARMR